MGIDRGYKGDRAGQGYGRKLPKRSQCPECDKNGVFRPDPGRWPVSAVMVTDYRECQFCRASWASSLSWSVSKDAADKRRAASSNEFAR